MPTWDLTLQWFQDWILASPEQARSSQSIQLSWCQLHPCHCSTQDHQSHSGLLPSPPSHVQSLSKSFKLAKRKKILDKIFNRKFEHRTIHQLENTQTGWSSESSGLHWGQGVFTDRTGSAEIADWLQLGLCLIWTWPDQSAACDWLQLAVCDCWDPGMYFKEILLSSVLGCLHTKPGCSLLSKNSQVWDSSGQIQLNQLYDYDLRPHCLSWTIAMTFIF